MTEVFLTKEKIMVWPEQKPERQAMFCYKTS